ncbi:peptidylprolyl isomerase [uncultured Shimia sp.]|uniref:peptidylprolyl isomerase n=1 Tax=uncultured Shimia sp. TaxID=573152 RepID=UPI00262C29CD|nr:peptidylprolyl isomerase [uncultured Shimia sp.]
MSKHLKIFRSFAIAAMLSGPVLAQETPDATTVVATVDGAEFTVGHMILMREALPDQYKALPDDVLFNALLDQIVQQAILSQSLTGDEPAAVVLGLENERRLLRAGAAINEVIKAGISDAELEAAYQTKYVTDFVGLPEYNASHILVETEEKAAELRVAITEGADFAETAKAESTGPSGPSGGELGWFGPGSMVPEFEQAVVDMNVGEVSQPVQTQFGWHLIILNDMRVQEAPALEQVRSELVSELQQEMTAAHIARLTETANVDRSGAEGMDPAILKQVDLLGFSIESD